jgi:pimeloyl-ACP methyl ester carboxylesterase
MYRQIGGALCAVVLGGLLGGCQLFGVKEQQEKLDAGCVISGDVRAGFPSKNPLVVLLVRITGPAVPGQPTAGLELADHFVLERAGEFRFWASPGDYGVAAFEDSNADLHYQTTEPFLRGDREQPLRCGAGDRVGPIALTIPKDGRSAIGQDLDITALQVRSVEDQANVTLGQATVLGEVVSLDDPRFSQEMAESGLWKPYDFVFNARPGLYFLEPYDPNKKVVLFVHGISGTPAIFKTLIDNLDHNRYQAWVYYYPSGLHLANIAEHLTQLMQQAQLRYGLSEFDVVAHSMGGLVTRGFLQRFGERSSVEVPLYVTISTPWAGHAAAALGVGAAPQVVRVWYDMAPGSDYQNSLYFQDPETRTTHRPLPEGTEFHMLFTYLEGETDDGSVTVASQLLWDAQRDAKHVYGINNTHVGILSDERAVEILNGLLSD